MPNHVAYLYVTDVRCNGSVAMLLHGRIAEAEFVILSRGAFLREGQYVPARRLAHDQIRSACAGRGASLREPWVLVGQ